MSNSTSDLLGARSTIDTPNGPAHYYRLDRLIESTRTLVIGDPLDPATDIGPVIDGAAAEKIRRYVEIGRREGKLELAAEVPPPVKLSRALFFTGWALVFLIAVTGTGFEITVGETCPSSNSGVPLCYFSLGFCVAIFLLYRLRNYAGGLAT